MIKFEISQENYDLLSKMIELAKQREPVQGEFCFSFYNYGAIYSKVEGIENCGTVGCLAGGYLPLIDNKRFYFEANGTFMDNDMRFQFGKLMIDLGEDLFKGLFVPHYQDFFSLENLSSSSKLSEVIENAKQILKLLKIKPNE